MWNWNYYKPTDLEKRIMKLYETISIKNPSEIGEKLIASRLNIILLYQYEIIPFAHENEHGQFIVLDNTLPEIQQRMDFFHELGHLFRGHEGNQTELPELFRGLQEEQAEHFTMYAMMPISMIQKLQLPEYDRDFPILLANEFKVPTDFARERWEQIKRRINSGRWEFACIEHERSRYRKANPANWCDEAKLMYRLAIQRKMKKGQGVMFR